MSTALQICAEAYRQAQVANTLTSFGTSQAFPYNNALGYLQDMVRDMNRRGDYWAMETSSALTYSAGVYQWTMSSQSPAIDPKKITKVWLEASNHWGELEFVEWNTFKQKFRLAAVQTSKPGYWTKWGDTLELSTKPDQDYTLTVYHIRQIPLPTITSSTFGSWPTKDEDVFILGVKWRVLKGFGAADWQDEFQLYEARINELLADMKQEHAAPCQMPANF